MGGRGWVGGGALVRGAGIPGTWMGGRDEWAGPVCLVAQGHAGMMADVHVS